MTRHDFQIYFPFEVSECRDESNDKYDSVTFDPWGSVPHAGAMEMARFVRGIFAHASFFASKIEVRNLFSEGLHVLFFAEGEDEPRFGYQTKGEHPLLEIGAYIIGVYHAVEFARGK